MISQPKFKVCRRLGARVFSKCDNPKLTLGPNKHKLAKRKHPAQLSEYGAQMIEKQKAKYVYGLRERQFVNYVKKASMVKSGNPAEWLYKELESRLDNIVYRLGFAKTRALARQLVSHGHITVNGRRVTIPSTRIMPGDTIGIRTESRAKKIFAELSETLKEHKLPPWLVFDHANAQGKILSKPHVDVGSESIFNLSAILEFYSR